MWSSCVHCSWTDCWLMFCSSLASCLTVWRAGSITSRLMTLTVVLQQTLMARFLAWDLNLVLTRIIWGTGSYLLVFIRDEQLLCCFDCCCTSVLYHHCHLLQLYTAFHKKKPLIFDYNSRTSWSIFVIFAPVARGINTPQYHVIYLLNCLMTS